MTRPVTLTGAVAALIFFSGCEQYRQAQQQKAYDEKRETALQNGWEPARREIPMAPRPRFAQDNPPMVSGGPPVILPMPIIVEAPPAPAPQPSAPQPVIFTGGGNGTTIAQQVGNSTIVSQFGGWNRGTTIAQQVGNSTIVSQFGGRGGSGTTIAQQVGDSTIVSQFGSAGRGTTVAQQVGDTTIVSQFGGGQPIGGYRPTYSPAAGVYGFGE